MAKTSKKKTTARSSDGTRKEYDFSAAVRGKYTGSFGKDVVMVTLEPDVARLFPDSKSVNEALRVLGKAAEKTTAAKRTRRRAG